MYRVDALNKEKKFSISEIPVIIRSYFMKNMLLVLSTFCALLLLFSFFPKDVSAFQDLGSNISLGNYYLKHDRYYEAITYYNKALGIDPNNFDSLLGKGYALDKLQKYEKAIPYLDKALKIYPHNFYALYEKAVALSGLGRDKEASVYYDLILKMDPKFPLAEKDLQAIRTYRH
jgi:tetratricopeptide (TPR) repeat protein